MARSIFWLGNSVSLNITDKDAPSKWSSHSLRVTAANELHRMNFTEAFIKKKLRWRSDASSVYLHNTIHIAPKHTLGLTKDTIKPTTKEMKEVRHVFRGSGVNSNTSIRFCIFQKLEYVATEIYAGIVHPRSPIKTNKKTKHNHNTPPPWQPPVVHNRAQHGYGTMVSVDPTQRIDGNGGGQYHPSLVGYKTIH